MSTSTTLYTQPSCQPCRGTVRELKKEGVEYEAIDVSTDPEALAFIKGLGHLQAPVVVVTGPDGAMLDHWSGYRPERVQRIKSLS